MVTWPWTKKNTSKHTRSDSLNLKPTVPLYPLQDFKVLYKYCIIIIIAKASAVLRRHMQSHNVIKVTSQQSYKIAPAVTPSVYHSELPSTVEQWTTKWHAHFLPACIPLETRHLDPVTA